MEASFDKAVRYNNVGAKHMERQDYHAAIKSLTAAFHSFKKTYNLSKQSGSEERCRTSPTRFNLDEWMKKMPSGDTNDLVVYQNPVFVPSDLEVSIEACGLVSTSITFNLAMSNHLDASQSKDKEILKTAVRLYEYGFSLERIRGKFFVSPFFLVTILNNLGHIHRLIENFDRSRKCFRQLLSTLFYLTQVKGANPADLEVFFGNSSLGLSHRYTHGAGAA